MRTNVEKLTKEEWVARYGGQALLDREGLEVVPCLDCRDSICHGWRVRKRSGVRPSGFYWVRDRRKPYEWTIARWCEYQHWWLVGWRPLDDLTEACDDSRFAEIGERIERSV